MSLRASKITANCSKEEISSKESTELYKRSGTATLERPTILDASYLRKLDMSLLSREKLMNIKNLLVKPQEHEDRSSNSSNENILSATSIHISDESTDSKVFIGCDDTGMKTRSTEKPNKNKTICTKSKKPKKSMKGNGDESVVNDIEKNVRNSDEREKKLIKGEDGYCANTATINRTYRVKNRKRPSIFDSPIETPNANDETYTSTTSSGSSPSPKSSLQKMEIKCKKSDENITKHHPKLIVKKNIAINKFSKTSLENLALKISKSKEKINVKLDNKSKKGVSHCFPKDKVLKEHVIEQINNLKVSTKSGRKSSLETKNEKLEKSEKIIYQTLPRQKKNSDPTPLKLKDTNSSHQHSLSKITTSAQESKENSTPKRIFLRKNSKESKSPNIVRKFMDPITGKLKTVDELSSCIKKIKGNLLKVSNSKSDSKKVIGKACPSPENNPRKSDRIESNCDIWDSDKSFDSGPLRKFSLSEGYKPSLKGNLNIDIGPKRTDRVESEAERRRRYFAENSSDATHLITGEKYEDLFKKSDIMPGEYPTRLDRGLDTEEPTSDVERCDDKYLVGNSPTMLIPDAFCNKDSEVFNPPEFRSLIVTPTFFSDGQSWNFRMEDCPKHFGTAPFSFHESHCRQVVSSDVLSSRCHNKVLSILVDIHEKHCRKTNLASTLSPSRLSSPAQLSSVPTPNKSTLRKPSTVICYLCGREFGKFSIGIHERQCLKKWNIENNKLAPNLRRPEPTRHEEIHIAGTNKLDTNTMGETALKS